MRIFVGIVGCALSLLLIIYRERIRAFMGTFAWAERRLGPGGTYTVLLLAGVFGFIFSLVYMTDSFGLFFGGIGVDFFKAVK